MHESNSIRLVSVSKGQARYENVKNTFFFLNGISHNCGTGAANNRRVLGQYFTDVPLGFAIRARINQIKSN